MTGPLTLRQKQSKFALMFAALLHQTDIMGYSVTLGEGYRSPEEAQRLAGLGKGIVNSLHCLRMAHDINLFKEGAYLTKSEDYEPLGIWWESQGGSWGGRFTRQDGNHFSLEHDNRK